ncbi:MAG: S26 family signal peptidase [Mesorhizobium sp.]|nr:S26 family signal peptidase [bacterium M00.F.Ca.ET.205.01.1.1]TGU49428.1 S26 family signal peptidase [bacterium M00.F.Ca.ET.152.01.1.1]TGV33527.1 S26 family signal peptidase [Mesorhizobium sp. M00.F.Ca.ET.186.01.1.1]TGZ40430.1 S26 family signal peptidase [bacterium M00.F.Ca.ET.162.01.1.1]TIW63171.1 MAG: S26 family signal peptidase [Mesorhizobium sp.]
MTRSAIALATALATTAALYPAVTAVSPRFIWNASASTPIGLYWIGGGVPFSAPDLVAFAPPEPLATLLADRGYLPKGVLLLKHIVAVSGQIVCRKGLILSVDGTEIGMALKRDRAGRDLPDWQGCRRISVGAVFLMNSQVRDSFDGRYFGLLPTDHIVGRAVPLWTDEQGDGRFQWHAPGR